MKYFVCDSDDAVEKFFSLDLDVEPRLDFIKKYRRETIMHTMAGNVSAVLDDCT